MPQKAMPHKDRWDRLLVAVIFVLAATIVLIVIQRYQDGTLPEPEMTFLRALMRR